MKERGEDMEGMNVEGFRGDWLESSSMDGDIWCGEIVVFDGEYVELMEEMGNYGEFRRFIEMDCIMLFNLEMVCILCED